MLVNEAKIFNFGSATPSGNARAVAAANVINTYVPGTVFVKKPFKNQWQVLMGTKVVMTLSQADAQPYKIKAQTLAATITQRLIDSAKLTPLSVNVSKVDMPLFSKTTINLVGWASQKATIKLTNPGIVNVTKVNGVATIAALRPGTTILVAQSGEEKVMVPISVLVPAFDQTKQIRAQVLGKPADANVVAGAVSTALHTRGNSPSGVSIWVRVIDPKPIASGQTQMVKARVKATGPGYFPFEGDVAVSVTNLGEVAAKEDELWYSNEPERLSQPGQLYCATLRSGHSSRLLYHHQSAYAYTQYVRYMIANSTEATAKVAIALGDSKPDKNPTRAGYVAGDQYISKWLRKCAEVVEIPPHSVVPLTIRKLDANETCSGIASLSLLKGGAESVQIVGDCVMKQNLYSDWEPGLNVIGAWHAVEPKDIDEIRLNLVDQGVGVFPKPYKEVRLDYEVGGRFGFTRIGDVPITNPEMNTSLAGNFGVIYEIEGTLKNGTSAPAEVEVLFEASAGYGSGLFVLNGEMLRIGLIQPKSEIVLASIKIPSGTSKSLKIQTMPLSGANYPVTLIVRPTGFESMTLNKRQKAIEVKSARS